MQPLRIGRLARLANVNVQTVRFYEREGLLSKPHRRLSGYREYPAEAVGLVLLIKRIQAFGFSLKEIKLIVKKDDYRVKVDGTDHVSAKLVLRADKKPKELDLVLETGPVYKGIYEIDGNTLKICLSLSSDADSERPGEFESKEGSSIALFTWARTN
jgi:uncharacterized protein (TIGR03067 family)